MDIKNCSNKDTDLINVAIAGSVYYDYSDHVTKKLFNLITTQKGEKVDPNVETKKLLFDLQLFHSTIGLYDESMKLSLTLFQGIVNPWKSYIPLLRQNVNIIQ